VVSKSYQLKNASNVNYWHFFWRLDIIIIFYCYELLFLFFTTSLFFYKVIIIFIVQYYQIIVIFKISYRYYDVPKNY